MTRLLPLVVVAALAAGVFHAQPQTQVIQAPQPIRDPAGAPQIGTSAIVGTVTTMETTPQAVRRATVSVSGGGLRGQRQTVTDASGRFAIADLPAGTFTLSASKPSYVSATYGARPGQGGTPIKLTAGQRVVADIRITRGSVITGTVFDQYGRPRPQVRMQAMQYRTTGGQRRLQPAGNGSNGGTDDRGVYRIYGLSAGDFVIAAITENNPDVRMITSDELRWAQIDPRAAMTGAAPPAPPPPGPTIGFAPIFYPGVADIVSATTVTIGAGEERAGVDFQLQAARTAKVEGLLLDPDGRPPQQPNLTMLPDERLRSLQQMAQLGLSSEYGRVDQATGKFTFSGVTPGHYTMLARSTIRQDPNLYYLNSSIPPPPPAPVAPVPPGRATGPGTPAAPPPPPTTLWAMAQIDVDGRDLAGITLTLQPGLTISGRVVFETTTLAAPTDLTRTRLTVSQIDPSPLGIGVPGVPANADGTFTLRGATPGRYRVSGSAPPVPGPQGGPWTLKSVVLNGRDTLDTGLDVPTSDVSGVVVTFSDRATDLSGTLLDTAGLPTPDLWVMCFSADPAYWTAQSRRTRVLRTQPDGSFRFSQWVPGEYFLVAVTDGDQVDLTDRAALEQFAAVAMRITLAEGEKKVQNLKVAR